MDHSVASLYRKHYTDKGFERLALFQLLEARYAVRSALYPGSFLHVTPSFVFPETVYVDTDRRAPRFFADPDLDPFIAARKTYPGEPQVRFHRADYRCPLTEQEDYFDLLISQYAGFVSQHCTRYLRIGGLLLANNSHGDASMASINGEYELVAIVEQRSQGYRLVEADLAAYLVPKSAVEVSVEYLEKAGRGIAYRKPANGYLFRRLRRSSA